jgi:predicted dehydrogenase
MITFALVGLGAMGQNYLDTLKNTPGAEIRYICDKNRILLDKYSTYHKIFDFKQLAKRKIDGVIIATPAATHFEIVSFFLERNIPVLVEKPLATNLKDAKQLLKINEGTPILVGHSLLYNPAYLKMKSELGKIGKIKNIKFTGKNNNPRQDTTVLYDWGSHGIAFILDILAKEPTSIRTIKKNERCLYSIMDFNDECKGIIDISWESTKKIRKLEITGVKGKLIFDDMASKKIKFLDFLKSKTIYPSYSNEQPLYFEILEFLDAILKKGKIKSDLNFGIKVVSILDQINKTSSKTTKSYL